MRKFSPYLCRILCGFFGLGLSGCAQLIGPSRNVPFVQQEDGHCGDSSLEMVLRYHGLYVDHHALRAMVYLPALQGTVPEVIADTARKLGYESEVTQLKIEELTDLIRQTGPTIVYFGAEEAPNPGHFLVVNDISPFNQRVCVHTGENSNQWLSAKEFNRRWQKGKNIVIRIAPLSTNESTRPIPRSKY
jgi:ABC-type bacteriocin/lantibiotic exporter with double-glycine peptidase domain